MAAHCPGCNFPKSVVPYWGLPVLARGREHCAEVGTHSDVSSIDLSSKKSVVKHHVCREDQTKVT